MEEYHSTEPEPAREAEFLEIDYPNALYRKAFAKLPEGLHNDSVKRLAKELLDKAAGGERWLLRNLVTKEFGPLAGPFLEHIIFWSGKSHAPSGWVYKSREELSDPLKGIALEHRDQEKARKILRGEKPWYGKTRKVLEEHRPSKRIATFYRVDLIALASILGAELSEPPHGATQTDDFDWDFDWEEDFLESESPHGATEPPHKATESPHGATTVGTTDGSFSLSLLQRAPGSAKAGSGAMDRDRKKEEKDSSPPAGDKRHSMDSETSSSEQAVKGEGEEREPVAPPKPNDDTLLAEITEILDPTTERWEQAEYVWRLRPYYTNSNITTFIAGNEELAKGWQDEEIRPAVDYVVWMMSKEKE
jgi:hypothetical protein